MPPSTRHNIIVFGETGAGKSSIINMLQVDGSNKAIVSSSASGCTLSSTAYEGAIGDQLFTFWDTAGLNEGDLGRVPDMNAVVSLYHLLHKLKGGVSLLVFCMKAPRVTEAGRKNWDLFCNLLCHRRVPVVLAITYLDQEDTDSWWSENESHFLKNGITPSKIVYRHYQVTREDSEQVANKSDVGVACITATKGKVRKNGGYALEEEYEESCWKIRKLVFESHLPEPWKAEPVKWFQEVVREVRSGHWLCPDVRHVTDYLPGQGVYKLMERWGMKSEEEAMEVAKAIEQGVE
jgi:GTPase SAR1 family protein